MSESLRLADVCEVIVDCKNRTPPECSEDEVYGYAVGTPHIKDGRIILQEAKRVNRSIFETWTSRSVPQKGDLIITREAPVGLVARIESDENICLGQRTMLARADSRIADSRFLHYFLRSAEIQDVLHGMASGSTVAHLKVGDVRNLALYGLPNLARQTAIAVVLGAIDDKITVNDRIALNSIDLAELIYLGASRTASWQVRSLGESAKWYSGGTPRTSEVAYWNGDIPWISASSLKNPWVFESDRSVTDLGAKSGTRLVGSDAIIFVVRGMSLATEFRVGITLRQVAFGQDCKALVSAADVDAATLFLALRSRREEVLSLVDYAGHGTGKLATDRLSRLPVRLPKDGRDAEEFAAKIRPLLARGYAAISENRSLAALRDALLPRLMSGEIRVKDAERIVEDAT